MRPSRRFLWIVLGALLLALLAVVAPVGLTEFALVPLGLASLAFAIDWISSRGPRSVGLTAIAESEVFSGEDVHLNLVLQPAHQGSKLPRKAITATLAEVEGLKIPARIALREGTNIVHVPARRRGQWRIESAWLYWKSRFGLIEFVPIRPLDLTVAVVPNIRAVTSGQIDLEMRSQMFGAKQTAWRGEGSEFHQMTEYVQGMDPRSIDWKHSARQHNLVAKEMRAERNHQIILAMDNGHMMREEIAGLPKIDHKINAALALAWAGVQGGDQVGLYAFDARPQLYSPPQPGRVAFSHIRSQMASLEYRSVQTNHTLALSHLHQRLSKRSLIIVFSDFADPLTAQLLVDHMAVLNKHHVIIYVSLRDPLLRTITTQKPETMTDIASSVSAANLIAERRAVLDQMAAMGVYVIEADPGDMTPRLLNTYLAIKSREEI